MSTSLTGSNHFITVETAKKMIATHKNQKDQIVKDDFKGKNLLPVSETFDRVAIDRLLSSPQCAGLRIYYGMDDNNRQHAILVAVNTNDEDILPSSQQMNVIATSSATDTISSDPVIVENGKLCPPVCSSPSPINP
ncbi:MAG TPA: hypothetical protein VFQ58_04940 [Flavisolibacter sp.]|jgi:hypothetical protein|nr:hypothetical protein [Flavisolibacter sp.]